MRHPLRLFTQLGALLLTLPSSAIAASETSLAPGVALSDVRVVRAETSRRILIDAGQKPLFTVLKLANPPRLVVDITGVHLGTKHGPIVVEDGLVDEIALNQYANKDAQLTRVTVSMLQDADYDARLEGDTIALLLTPRSNQSGGASGVDQETAHVSNGSPSVPARLSFEDKLSGDAQKARVSRVRTYANRVVLTVPKNTVFESRRLEHPDRVVIDIPGGEIDKRVASRRLHSSWVKGLRVGRDNANLRLVLDLQHPEVTNITQTASGIEVSRQTPTSSVSVANASMSRRKEGPTLITGITVDSEAEDRGRETCLNIQTRGALNFDVASSNSRRHIIHLFNATLDPGLAGKTDHTAEGGPVLYTSLVQTRVSPPEVDLIIDLGEDIRADVSKGARGLSYRMLPLGPAPQITTQSPMTAAFAAQNQVGTDQGVSPPSPLDRRISLDVKDADIANVIRLISEETGENIITSDEVHGKVTLKLRDVPAEQALDTMLRTKGFDKVRHNNILRVAASDTIQKERDHELARKRSQAEVEDTLIKMVAVNYAQAKEVIDQLKPMLSPRGSVQVDERTNTIILQDIGSNIDRLVDLSRRLDKQTPLVNIQARIVEAQSNYLRDLGVQWGGMSQQTARTGNATGLAFPGDLMASGAADDPAGNQVAGVSSPARYAVNLPASLAKAGGGIGFILGSAGGSQLLNLRLTAMETNGAGKIISSPEVSTLDNRTARVSQGVEIPISVVSAAGTNTRLVPALLQLEVTPHVTNDGTVLLKIHVQKSEPDFSQKSGAGDPTIQKKEAETEVLVRDGDTSVIGGIYTRNQSDSYSEIPFLARIPLLGLLFREHRAQDNRTELLVFITPRIINRDESTVPAGELLEGTKNR